MRRVFIGIDCGTQSTKALILDADTGGEISVGQADHALVSRPDGTREQDPRRWVDAAATAVRGALQGSGRVEVAGMSVSGQQHGLVALDSADQPVRPAKLWNDTATVDACRSLTVRMGGEEAVHAATGNVFLPAYTAPKVEWLRCVEPESYRRSVRLCLPHDYLNLWLTGRFLTEAGDASGTAYFDVRSRAYADGVLDVIDPDRDWAASLPPILASSEVLGFLRPAAAEVLGLPAGLPVATGGGDTMCAAIGVGAVTPGAVVMSLGTSGTVFGSSPTVAIDPLREVSAFCSSTGDWLPLACVLNCTLPINWVMGLFGYDRAAFEAAVISTPMGSFGARFVPYLDGERTPNRPKAAGQLLGLRAEHGPDAVCRAVLEGVTAGLAHAVRAFERTGAAAQTIMLVGGGARSTLWGQLLADWLGLRIERPAVSEAAARGAAIQAAHVVAGMPVQWPLSVEMTWEPTGAEAVREVAASYRQLGDDDSR